MSDIFKNGLIESMHIQIADEDAFNNLLIEMYQAEKRQALLSGPSAPISTNTTAAAGPSVAITLTPKNFVNYLDLEDQNN